MSRVSCLVPLVALALASPGAGGEGDKAKKPHLAVRATPPVAFSPVQVLVVGRLEGGVDQDEFYCPAVEWEWGDGERSTRESDCVPFDADTKMARLFTATHSYRESGDYSVRLTLRRGGRSVAAAAASISVLARGEDPGGAFASSR